MQCAPWSLLRLNLFRMEQGPKKYPERNFRVHPNPFLQAIFGRRPVLLSAITVESPSVLLPEQAALDHPGEQRGRREKLFLRLLIKSGRHCHQSVEADQIG